MENTKKEPRGQKYYDIIIEEKTTGRKMGPMTAKEAADVLGTSPSYLLGCCKRGFYKNYKITSKMNEIWRGMRPKDEDTMKKAMPINKATVNESTTNALKLCFEGLRIIENQYAQYGFADIATFIKWMYDNRWVEKAL